MAHEADSQPRVVPSPSPEFLADFHVHSTFSDGKLSVPEVVDLYGRHGFGAIAITDHICEERTLIGKAAGHLGQALTASSFPLYAEILKSEARRAWNEYGMVVLPGYELSKNTLSNRRSAHILGIGVSEYLSADGESEDLAAAIQDRGGIAVAAHPVSTGRLEKQTFHLWDRRSELAAVFDAWEVASGPQLFEEVLASGLPLLANGDLHSAIQLRSWKTVLRCPREPAAILTAIRQQDVRFHFFSPGTPGDGSEGENHHVPSAHDLGIIVRLDPLGHLFGAETF